jgi:hypothetical protein
VYDFLLLEPKEFQRGASMVDLADQFYLLFAPQ